jgi:quercetin dioxygenase-like cupin family protein
VKIVRFDPARPITQHGSTGAAVAGIARVHGPAQVVCIRLGAGGILGEHPAAAAQLFLVVVGSGWVRSGADRRDIAAGSGAYWEPNELHESGSHDGLTAVVVEAESIELV